MNTDHVARLAVIKAKCEQDFTFFVRYFFKTLKGAKFKFSKHHYTIARALMDVYEGKTTHLIINMPPRYSKCVNSDTLVLTNNGYQKAMNIKQGDIVQSHIDGKLVPQRVRATEAFEKQCVNVTTTTGRMIKLSHDHPVLTQRGWVDAENLTDEHYLIRVKSVIDGNTRIDDSLLDFLALMIFEGGCSDPKGRNIRFTSTDESIVNILNESCSRLGIKVKQYDCNSRIDYNLMGGSSGIAANILREHDLLGCLAKNKRLPKVIFDLPIDQKYRFLSLMVATDGYVAKANGQIGITLASEWLIDDLSLLLDTCGITALKYRKDNDHIGAYELKITAKESEKLAQHLNCLHKQEVLVQSVSEKVRKGTNVFGYPHDVSKGLTGKCRRAKPKIDFKNGRGVVSYDKFERMCNEIDPTLRDKWCKDDFMYDRVKMVEQSDVNVVHHIEVDSDVYDHKNYVCNGFVVHNTELAVKMFSAWCFIKNPKSEFIHLSYSDGLALDNSDTIKELIKTSEFQELWPHIKIKTNKDSKKAWGTEQGGVFYATAAGGAITGFGAGKVDDFKDGNGFGGAIIIDDPLKPDDATSDPKRNAVNRRWDETIKSRFNSTRTPCIVIMQRLHEDDFCAMLLRDEEYNFKHLVLPAIVDEDGPNEHALWPEKHTLDQLKVMKRKNSYMFSGQMQQRPSPLGGGILRGEWFKRYTVLPKMKYRAIFVDTAQKAKEHNDYQVAEVWGLSHDGDLYLIDVLRDKFQAYELETRIPNFWNKHRTADTGRLRYMAVEDKSSGTELIQKIRKKTKPRIPVIAIPRGPNANKLTRVMDVQGYIESGFVYIPDDSLGLPWVHDFIDECEKFTADDAHKNDDQIDPMCDAISKMLHNGRTSIEDML